jgi:hypothetical protein
MDNKELKKILTFKNEGEFNSFKINIQNSYKKDNRIERDKIRVIINPLIRKRDNYKCCFCGNNVLEVNGSNTIHHKIPERYNGLTEEKNLITICCKCHNLLETYISIVEKESVKATCEYIKSKLN